MKIKNPFFELKITISVLGIMLICLSYSCADINKKGTKQPVNSQVNGHSSQNSVDWEGSYRTIMPCADCPGIETVISLHKNNAYQLSQKYLGKARAATYTSGTFTWAEDGSKIKLGNTNESWVLQVGENQLFLLDKEEKKITSALADRYRLVKENNSIKERYWKLITLLAQPVKTTGTREAYLIFKQQDNRLNGHDGCNSLNGSYSVSSKDQIKIEQIISTEMACIDQGIQQKLTSVLPSADSYLVKEDTLLLYDVKKLPLARFEAVYLR